MKRPGSHLATRTFAIVTLLLVVPFLALPIPGIFALIEACGRLLLGFAFFLSANLHKISSDAGTWGPGLAAFLLGLAVIHGFGRSWAQRRQQGWRASTTFSLGLLLPLLFAISFLVPGVFLQVQQLAKAPWFVREFGEASYFKQQLKQLGLALIDAELDDERYPDSLEVLVNRKRINADDLFLRGQYAGHPREPVLYLGKGLTTSSDPSLPLLISPPYSQDGSVRRMILTAGHEVVEIRAEELDAWIARAMAARDGVKP
ncbi:hypothetical protein OKA05_07310 [Luteolibacter arcticus]|uniref:Uncharacterized protein n=1 Tax=Luteolibacter arcticus TaxID=1581411 RepID=A0ABT3GFW9_9BACT|nr:hypothetical protein [Luteolibacter arcticus]MCW1922356.1 hypothetical protein [Luteolibacter arcticus]